MKIKGPSGPSKTAKTGASKSGGAKSSSSTSAFEHVLAAASDAADAAEASPQVAGAGVVSHVDVLLMAQAAEDPAQGKARRHMRRRGDRILDALDVMRDKLLTGQLSVADMLDVAASIATHKARITDPAMEAVLEEIDLRAQVEIAKMRRAMDTDRPLSSR